MTRTPFPLAWITDQPANTYWVLGFAGAACAFAYYTSRKMIFLLGVGIVALLAGGVWLVDYLVVTDREQVEKNTQALVAAAQAGDIDRLASFVSRAFQRGNQDRNGLINQARRYLPPDPLRRISIWNLTVAPGQKQNLLVCECMARATGRFGGQTALWDTPYRLEFTLIKDADGQWRLQNYKVYPGLGNQELHVPD